MAFVTVEAEHGSKQVRVCDYCKAVCIPSGRFCSGYCARNYREWQERLAKEKSTSTTKEPRYAD